MSEVLPLRDYQRDALAAVAAAAAEGCRRQLVVLPAGSGRSVLMGHLLAEHIAAGGRALVLAHRSDLLRRLAERLRAVWPDAPVAVAGRRGADPGARFLLASVQDLSRPGRLGAAAASNLRLVVTAEAQHSAAATYRRIARSLGLGAPGGPLHVGFAPAACRTDGAALGVAFDRIVFALDASALVEAGWLVPPQIRPLPCPGEGDAAARLAAAWLREAGDRPTLALLPSAAAAESLAAAVNHLTGTAAAAAVRTATREVERARLLAALESGGLRLLATASSGEGLAVPAVSCLLLARRCGTDASFAQVAGRGLRPWPPHKRDCLILDAAGSSARRSLNPPAVLFGREPPATGAGTGRSRAPRSLTLSVPVPGPGPVPLAPRAAFAWTRVAPGVFLLALPPARASGGARIARDLVVRRLAGGRWAAEAVRRPVLAGAQPEVRRLWTSPAGASLGRAEAFGAAETHLAADRAAHRFAGAGAAWRRRPDPASAAQLALLGRLGVPAPAGLDRAAASERITAALGRRRLAAEIREAAEDEGR